MPKTILVIDDNSLVRDVVGTILQTRGYAVLCADDGPPALQLYDEGAIDGALVDVDMPVMNGLEVCRELRARAAERGKPIFVWMMTGITRPEVAAGARAAGALGVLAKPFTTQQLLTCIETSIKAKSAA